jgi:hypothetical protein
MSIADTGRFWEILVIPVLQILEDSEKHCTITEGVDRRYAYPFSCPSSPFSHPFSHFSHLASPFSLPSFFSPLFSFLPPLVSFLPVPLWEILVIPVLQILEDSGKYWLYQYCRYWKISYEVAECTCILFFFVLSVCLL